MFFSSNFSQWLAQKAVLAGTLGNGKRWETGSAGKKESILVGSPVGLHDIRDTKDSMKQHGRDVKRHVQWLGCEAAPATPRIRRKVQCRRGGSNSGCRELVTVE
jgi:hypothetical protein